MVHTSGSDRLFTYTDIFIFVSSIGLAKIVKGITYREGWIGALVSVRISGRRLGRRELDRECHGGRGTRQVSEREVNPPLVDILMGVSSASSHNFASEQGSLTGDDFTPKVGAAELGPMDVVLLGS